MDNGLHEAAKKKLVDSLRITNEIKAKQNFDGSYWKTFDFYVNKVTD
jgi:hypothetical protein